MTASALLPRSPASELSRRVRDANTDRRPLRVVGAGTWLATGAPIDATEDIHCASCDEIIEYVPGDLTITVGAGMSLAAIAEATTAHGQWLTLDPYGSSTGTIGATVATASSGPLTTGFGTPRDLVLGIEGVTGTGNVIRAGGRVVKNVAGFDLVRLFTGSRGTLGIITEVTLRLRARPARDLTIAIAIENTAATVRAVCRALRGWPFTPMAAEIIDGSCAAVLALPQTQTLLLRLGGNARAITSQRQRAAALGKAVEVDATVWDKLRSVERGSVAVVRVADLPSAFAERWDDAQQLCGRGGVAIGSPARGTIRCVLGEFETTRVTALRAKAKTAVLVFDTLPTAAAWHSLTTEMDPASLDARVRAAFDPARILNPGIMRVVR
jgi:glycolate oxidase FAD binding subunit